MSKADLDQLKAHARLVSQTTSDGSITSPEIERLVKTLKNMLRGEANDLEPHYTSDGRSPVVAWTRTFHNKTYSYAAVGVSDEYGELVWYVSNDNKPKSWPDLVKFMGMSGLSTLEVLRTGVDG